jgi:hypothetical protein
MKKKKKFACPYIDCPANLSSFTFFVGELKA